MAAEMSRFGSFVSLLAITTKTICPGWRIFRPSSAGTCLHPGGRMLETWTRLNFSIPGFPECELEGRELVLVDADALREEDLRGNHYSVFFILIF